MIIGELLVYIISSVVHGPVDRKNLWELTGSDENCTPASSLQILALSSITFYHFRFVVCDPVIYMLIQYYTLSISPNRPKSVVATGQLRLVDFLKAAGRTKTQLLVKHDFPVIDSTGLIPAV